MSTMKMDETIKQAIVDFWRVFPAEANRLAHEKGWWDQPRDADTLTCLLHSEWSEAFEEWRRDGDDCLTRPISSYGPDGKPEGFWVEIADFLIRLADLLGEQKMDVANTIADFPAGIIYATWVPQKFVAAGHRFCCNKSIQMYGTANFIDLCHAQALQRGVDLLWVITKKHEYNKSRPHRHGGKHA